MRDVAEGLGVVGGGGDHDARPVVSGVRIGRREG